MFSPKSSWLWLITLSILTLTKFTYAQNLAPDIQQIIDKNKIVIAMVTKDQPPFFMKNKEGKLVGFDVELAKGIAEELGVEAVFNRTSKTFNGTVDLVVNNEADIAISKLSRTLTRAKRVLFTRPYIVLRKGLLINRLNFAKESRGYPPMTFIKNMKGDVGVIAASSYVGFSKRMFPNANIKEYIKWEDAVNAVMNGNILAAFRDELEIKKVVKGNPDNVIRLQTVIFKDTKDPIAMAVASDRPHLLFWLNQYLDSLEVVMNADMLLDKYQHLLITSE